MLAPHRHEARAPYSIRYTAALAATAAGLFYFISFSSPSAFMLLPFFFVLLLLQLYYFLSFSIPLKFHPSNRSTHTSGLAQPALLQRSLYRVTHALSIPGSSNPLISTLDSSFDIFFFSLSPSLFFLLFFLPSPSSRVFTSAANRIAPGVTCQTNYSGLLLIGLNFPGTGEVLRLPEFAFIQIRVLFFSFVNFVIKPGSLN